MNGERVAGNAPEPIGCYASAPLGVPRLAVGVFVSEILIGFDVSL